MHEVGGIKLKSTAVVFTAPETVQLSQLELGKLADDEVLIETHCSLISAGTERLFFRKAFFYPFTPGYSVAGNVVEKGSLVTKVNVGDRVFAIAHHGSLVKCNEAGVAKIPDGLSYQEATFGTVGSMAMHAARRADIDLAEPVAVMGQGLIGLIATQLARMAGAFPLIAIDLSDARLQLSQTLGADFIFNARQPERILESARMLNGGGADAVIELTASPPAVELAIDITRERGRIFLGSVGDDQWKANVYGAMWRKGISMIGGFVNSKPHALRQTIEVLKGTWPPLMVEGAQHFGPGSWTGDSDTQVFHTLVSSRRVNVKSLITHDLQPEEVVSGFRLLNSNDPSFIGAIIHWK